MKRTTKNLSEIAITKSGERTGKIPNIDLEIHTIAARFSLTPTRGPQTACRLMRRK